MSLRKYTLNESISWSREVWLRGQKPVWPTSFAMFYFGDQDKKGQQQRWGKSCSFWHKCAETLTVVCDIRQHRNIISRHSFQCGLFCILIVAVCICEGYKMWFTHSKVDSLNWTIKIKKIMDWYWFFWGSRIDLWISWFHCMGKLQPRGYQWTIKLEEIILGK